MKTFAINFSDFFPQSVRVIFFHENTNEKTSVNVDTRENRSALAGIVFSGADKRSAVCTVAVMHRDNFHGFECRRVTSSLFPRLLSLMSGKFALTFEIKVRTD